MLIDKEFLDNLSAQAKSSPKLRMHYDLRNSPDDNSQRILNAMDSGTELPIHRHKVSSETIVMLRGKGRWNYYDDKGNLTESHLISDDGELRSISVPFGQWHNSEIIESGIVIFEAKDGKYEPLNADDLLYVE